jgi:hypothetical protein
VVQKTKLEESIVNELARDCEFMQRNRKLTAYDLIESVLFSKFETDKLSLNDHCVYLLVHKGIIIRKQSVDERFNEKAVAFIKKLLERTLSEELLSSNKFPVLDRFSKVRIKDSVSFQLPDSLKDVYPGSGGAASKAMAKIQFEYDFLSRQILELAVTPFTKNDSSNAKDTVDNIQTRELVLRDLGYVSIPNMQTISEEKGSYFLNKLNTSTTAYYIKNQNPVSFHELESKMRKNGIAVLEHDIYIGKEQMFPVRMIVSLVSEENKQHRIRERRKWGKKKKQAVSNEALARCGLNIYITNADKDILPIESVVPIYGIRWQIENIFKVWKSVGGIHKVKKISKERFEFYLFSKLIFLIKSWHIMRIIELITQDTISYYKYLKTASLLGWDQMDLFAKKIIQAVGVEQFIIKDFRKDRIHEKSLKQILNTCISTI